MSAELYADWPEGQIDALCLVLSNQGLPPQVVLCGDMLVMSLYQPATAQWPQHKYAAVGECMVEAIDGYARRHGFALQKYDDAPGCDDTLLRVRSDLRDIERRLYRENSPDQFWCFLGRAFGLRPWAH